MRFALGVGALLAGVLGSIIAAHASTQAPEVRAAFERYVQVLGDRDGAAAAIMVTGGSLVREERLRDLALSAPADVVAALPPADRLAILRLRHEFIAEELRPLSGADLVRIAVDEVWSSPKVLGVLTVTGVEQAGDTATLAVERAGEQVPIRLVLRREDGSWKLDLVELARGSDAALEAALRSRAERAGVDFHTAVTWAIEDTSGHLVDKDLWRPLAGPAG